MAFILVVDDEDATTGMMRDLLTARGHEVLVFADAYTTLDFLREGEPPDLIITDIMMPGMDGQHLSDAIRVNPRTRRIPIIAMTAKGSLRNLMPDAAAFLEKPFKIDALTAAVEKALAK